MNGSESRALVVAVDRIVSRLERVGEYAWLRNPEYRFHFVNEPFAAVYVYLDATGVGQLIVDSVAEWGIKAWILPFYFTHGDRRNQGLEKGDARQGFPRLEAPGAAPEPSSPPHTTEHMGDFVQENRERPGTDRSVLPQGPPVLRAAIASRK